jgi:triosephosphate isomerase
MKHFTIAGNWKMHMDPDEASRFIERLSAKVEPHTHVTNILCPPFIDLTTVKDLVDSDKFKVGAQNLHDKDEGAYTGEISGTMLKGLVEFVIVGHSERRRDFFESDKLIAAKLAAAVRNGLKPILCVGEKLDERQDGHSKRVVVDQLHGAFTQLTADDVRNLTIAYEPVWAIGTGKNATPDEVTPVVGVIRETLEEVFGEAASSQVEILYGGSSNPDNARAYLELENINGLLVGGASINYEQFASIIKTAQELAK